MRLSFPILLSSDKLTLALRWRLVDAFYTHVRVFVESCCAVSIVAMVGFARSGHRDFVATLAASLVILGGRFLHARKYARAARSGGAERKTPEHWAKQFMVWSLVTASLWSALDVNALLTKDAMLQFLVIAVQGGWLSAACMRNAASPATVFWQATILTAPGIVCLLLSQDRFLYTLVPLSMIQFTGVFSVSNAIAGQITATMLSEQRLEEANVKLTELSATDGLTGIANRRAFDAALSIEWARAARDGSDLGMLMIDVDYFKAYNDCYGHPAGDDCLRLIAELTARTLRRPPDTAARFGGEEFVALLPGTNAVSAEEVAERVRLAIMESGVAHSGSLFGRVTVSIGVASFAPHPGHDAQALIDLADRALYEAKHAGRNVVRRAVPVLTLAPWIDNLAGFSAPSFRSG